MNAESSTLDHEPKERRKMSVLRRPSGPTIWSLALSTKELLIICTVILGAIVGLLKFGSDLHWMLWAKDKVDTEVETYTVPINDRLKAHESAMVTKADYAVHLEQEVRDREALRGWMGTMSQRVDFIYQEAYRQRFGAPPPRLEIGREPVQPRPGNEK